MDEQSKSACLIRFGESLRGLRLEAGFSQEELAERANIDRSYLGAIERGEHNVALLNIIKIANALSLNPCQLLEVFSMEKGIR
ncbi:helix-turn-helix transcriptional regulator [Undibacterium jejuense]|uniref:Helix-turn-helix transcriptional regulator n=1 Tax=Undibacterium jejuense TaxID=1344949 RepID=A0A923HNK5_9BURK|nr:helix-turn-helix transcriptional regulator [Undibacterium jejuense]MBC3864244.1 helix-turn-helix transcriptional regulator [Undibacterium jejuense]